VPLVDDLVGHGLPDEVVADSPAAQVVLVEQRPLIRDVGGIGESLIDLEVIAPTGEFQPVVAPAFG